MKTLKIGQKVQIEFKGPNSENIQIICSISQIFEDRLILSYPKELTNFFEYLPEGTEINAYIYTDSNIQAVDSIVLTAPYDNEFEIEYSEDYRTIQRRAYIRENVECRVILQNEEMTANGISKDLGGGGCRFTTNDNLELETYMEIWINLEDKLQSAKAIGKVSKKAHYQPNEYLIEFSEISENDRNRIIKKCITYQVSQMRNND